MKQIIESSVNKEDLIKYHSDIELPAKSDISLETPLIIKVSALVKLYHETTNRNFTHSSLSLFSAIKTSEKSVIEISNQVSRLGN